VLEASKLLLKNMAPNIPDIQVSSSSFWIVQPDMCQWWYLLEVRVDMGNLTTFSLVFLGVSICMNTVRLYLVCSVNNVKVQSLSSFTSTVIGTAVRIPCEVLKQRLQAGLYHNVGEAIVATYQQDGLRGFFRGTGVTLCREVPFYVAGMGIYEEAKKVNSGNRLNLYSTFPNFCPNDQMACNNNAIICLF
jgi:hypothetical protein